VVTRTSAGFDVKRAGMPVKSRTCMTAIALKADYLPFRSSRGARVTELRGFIASVHARVLQYLPPLLCGSSVRASNGVSHRRPIWTGRPCRAVVWTPPAANAAAYDRLKPDAEP